jgi:hypothetical protein
MGFISSLIGIGMDWTGRVKEFVGVCIHRLY